MGTERQKHKQYSSQEINELLAAYEHRELPQKQPCPKVFLVWHCSTASDVTIPATRIPMSLCRRYQGVYQRYNAEGLLLCSS